MLEILTDKSVCEREDFLFDVNSIFVDIEIKGTEFNREIVKLLMVVHFYLELIFR